MSASRRRRWTRCSSAWGNPSSAHKLGVEAARRVARARDEVAAALGGSAAEVTFTSGGTEANAIIVGGVAARAKHVVVSGFEHPSVADAAKALAERGVEVTIVAPSAGGVVSADAFAAAVRADTALVACMLVQNEIGTVQPVDAIARAVKARAPRCHVHVDAVQAIGKLAIDVADAAFDSLAISAHKIHGPKGAGALWLKKGARARPLVFGGGQERGLRPGTEGVPGIVALGVACDAGGGDARGVGAAHGGAARAAVDDDRGGAAGGAAQRRGGEHGAAHPVGRFRAACPRSRCLHALEADGVYVSAGSACHAKDKKPSATLRAIGVPDDVGVIRLSLSRFTTDEEDGARRRSGRGVRAKVVGIVSESQSGDAAVGGEVVLVRWGEIFLKGDNRGFFERMLVERVKKSLAGMPGARIERTHGRLVVWPGEVGARRAVRALERVFGISSVSPARVVARDVGGDQRRRRRAGARRGAEVRAPDLQGRVAPQRQALPDRLDGGVAHRRRRRRRRARAPRRRAHAGLHHRRRDRLRPRLRLRRDRAGPRRPARRRHRPRRAPALGRHRLPRRRLDDAQARLLPRRDLLPLVPLHGREDRRQGGPPRVAARRLAARPASAWRSCPSPTRRSSSATPRGDGKLAVVLYRRAMLRVAERIAARSGAKALATGEALAQVASQTLENLGVIGAAATMPVLRPCLGHDKLETIAIAQRIGTFETSIEPYDDCCSLFVPDHPETRAKLGAVEAIEARLNLPAMIDDLAARATERICRP